MNAIGTPAAAGTGGSAPGDGIDDRRDWLRVAGGMMFGAGALVLLVRKSGDWSDWAIFFALLIPALVLLAVAVIGRAAEAGAVVVGTPRQVVSGWHVAFLVFGTLLLLASLLQLVNAADGNPQASLNLLWTFGVCAALAVVSSLVLRAQFQMLLGALLGLVAWLALWDKVLSNPSGDTVRWLLIVLAIIYVVAAIALMRGGRPQASDLITAAGIASVFAAALSFAGAASVFSDSVGSSLSGDVPKPGQGWNIFLLVVSLLLIAYESRAPTRGPGYVGAIGLLAFIGLTGADLVNRLNGEEGGGVVGWPLILLIGGGAALLLSFVLRPGALGGTGGDGYGGPGGPGQGAYAQPGVGQPGYGGAPGQPGATTPGQAVPPPPPQGGQQGGLLDQWRQQPPPGGQPPRS